MNITLAYYLDDEKDPTSDVVVPPVEEALKQNGHKVSLLGVHGDLGKLLAGLRRRKPDLIFNLMESFGDSLFGAVGVVGFLDLFGVPYTGGGPGEFYIQEDKSLTKKLLAFDGVPCPDFAVFSRDSDLETGGRLRMPLFVKPLRMDASIGIDAGSLVHSLGELVERVTLIHEKVKDSALVEEYVEGREFYVGVLGNATPQPLPPIEMDFTGFPEGRPHVVDSRAKWDEKSAEYKGTRSVLADLPDDLRARLQKVAVDAYRALRVRDYGRIDLRLTETGEIYVIEVNASCYLEKSSEFAVAAAAAGLDYPTLIDRIMSLALERREQPRKDEVRTGKSRKRTRRRTAAHPGT
jgi:D-alanine-D-alanine ligase